MTLAASVRTVLGRYATFSGRARRSEYWWWILAVGIVYVAVSLLSVPLTAGGESDLGLAIVGLVFIVFVLAVALPTVAVSVRRLHDTGRSGWWYLLSFVPFGGIVLIVFYCGESAPDNQYGPHPRGVGYAGGPGQPQPGWGPPPPPPYGHQPPPPRYGQ